MPSIGVDTTPPAAPTGLTALGAEWQISLDWNDNTEGDLASYNVYRSSTSGSGYIKQNATPITGSNYTDCLALLGQTYYYIVTAEDTSWNESIYSNQASAAGFADTTPPAVPTGLTATANSGAISLNWNDNGEGDLAGYNVYRGTSSGGPYSKKNVSLAVNSSYTDSGTANGTTYYYVVTAVDTVLNESNGSNEASATSIDTTPPARPTGLTAIAGAGIISLDWNDNNESDLEQYDAYVYWFSWSYFLRSDSLLSFQSARFSRHLRLLSGLSGGLEELYQLMWLMPRWNHWIRSIRYLPR